MEVSFFSLIEQIMGTIFIKNKTCHQGLSHMNLNRYSGLIKKIMGHIDNSLSYGFIILESTFNKNSSLNWISAPVIELLI